MFATVVCLYLGSTWHEMMEWLTLGMVSFSFQKQKLARSTKQACFHSCRTPVLSPPFTILNFQEIHTRCLTLYKNISTSPVLQMMNNEGKKSHMGGSDYKTELRSYKQEKCLNCTLNYASLQIINIILTQATEF
jgi:hypothetical protein